MDTDKLNLLNLIITIIKLKLSLVNYITNIIIIMKIFKFQINFRFYKYKNLNKNLDNNKNKMNNPEHQKPIINIIKEGWLQKRGIV